MNDLKAYTHVSEELDAETGKYALYAYDVDGNRTPVDDTELVYLKSDVDKVIADLEESHKNDCAYWKMQESNAVNAIHETDIEVIKETK